LWPVSVLLQAAVVRVLDKDPIDQVRWQVRVGIPSATDRPAEPPHVLRRYRRVAQHPPFSRNA
jgi:hypothetical protein